MAHDRLERGQPVTGVGGHLDDQHGCGTGAQAARGRVRARQGGRPLRAGGSRVARLAAGWRGLRPRRRKFREAIVSLYGLAASSAMRPPDRRRRVYPQPHLRDHRPRPAAGTRRRAQHPFREGRAAAISTAAVDNPRLWGFEKKANTCAYDGVESTIHVPERVPLAEREPGGCAGGGVGVGVGEADHHRLHLAK